MRPAPGEQPLATLLAAPRCVASPMQAIATNPTGLRGVTMKRVALRFATSTQSAARNLGGTRPVPSSLGRSAKNRSVPAREAASNHTKRQAAITKHAAPSYVPSTDSAAMDTGSCFFQRSLCVSVVLSLAGGRFQWKTTLQFGRIPEQPQHPEYSPGSCSNPAAFSCERIPYVRHWKTVASETPGSVR